MRVCVKGHEVDDDTLDKCPICGLSLDPIAGVGSSDATSVSAERAEQYLPATPPQATLATTVATAAAEAKESAPPPSKDALLFLEETKEVAKAGIRIAMLGFSSSGKTWLLYRLLDLLAANDFSIKGTLKVPRTGDRVASTEHEYVFSAVDSHDLASSVQFIDVQGEQFRDLIAGGYSPLLSRYLNIVHQADAYIFVLPAEEFLLCGKRGGPSREKTEEIKQWLTTLQEMAAAIALMDQYGGPDNLPENALDPHQLHYSTARSRKPAYLALSKTDEIVQKINDAPEVFVDQLHLTPDNFDTDPALTVLSYQPTFTRLLLKAFGWAKIDFVTAFEGQAKDSVIIDYDLHHYGCYGIVSWLRAAHRRDERRSGRALDAYAVRSLYDPVFRQLLSPRGQTV